MDNDKAKQDGCAQYKLNIPKEIYEDIRERAAEQHRSLSGEMIHRIASYSAPADGRDRTSQLQRMEDAIQKLEALATTHIMLCDNSIDVDAIMLEPPRGGIAIIPANETMSVTLPGEWKFQVGDTVMKKSGSWWEGRVVGTYSTEQTPRGYCVQLQLPGQNGPVQIYPESALIAMAKGER